MHGHLLCMGADHRPIPPNVGARGQLASLWPSAVSLGNLEKIGNVLQSLADVVPKTLGILWKPRAQTRLQARPCPSVPTSQDASPARWAQWHPSSGLSRSRLTVSELENMLET